MRVAGVMVAALDGDGGCGPGRDAVRDPLDDALNGPLDDPLDGTAGDVTGDMDRSWTFDKMVAVRIHIA